LFLQIVKNYIYRISKIIFCNLLFGAESQNVPTPTCTDVALAIVDARERTERGSSSKHPRSPTLCE
jgi:hypothetical protein